MKHMSFAMSDPYLCSVWTAAARYSATPLSFLRIENKAASRSTLPPQSAMRLGESTGSRCVPGRDLNHSNARNLPEQGNVEMLVLDTDHVSVMEWSEGPTQQNLPGD